MTAGIIMKKHANGVHTQAPKRNDFKIIFGFHFRWLNTKGIDVAFSISIMLFFNHLK